MAGRFIIFCHSYYNLDMNNQSFTIFLIPVLALILAIVLYAILLNKADDKAAFKKFILTTLILAFLLNLVWEILQVSLYKGGSHDVRHIIFCALASVADAIMVLILYFGFALIYKNPLWIRNLTWQRINMLVLAGGAGSIFGEMRHLSSGNWTYEEAMPIIPVVHVGLSPVLQFMVLPVIIYALSFYFSKKLK